MNSSTQVARAVLAALDRLGGQAAPAEIVRAASLPRSEASEALDALWLERRVVIVDGRVALPWAASEARERGAA